MADNFPGHWQIDREWLSGLAGGGGSIRTKSNADQNDLATTPIRSLLRGNMYAEIVDALASINLPRCKSFSYENHLLRFETPYITGEIDFRGSSVQENIGSTGLGQKLSAKYGKGIYLHLFRITFDATPKRWRRWSRKTQEQMIWFKEVAEMYNQAFSFDSIKNTIT